MYSAIQVSRSIGNHLRYLGLVLLLVVHLATAQFMEFGAGVGVTQYAGDLSSGYRFSTAKPAFSGHYRLNFSEIVSNRFSLTIGEVKASDERSSVDVLGDNRQHSFNNTLLEISSVFEYHFLDYKNHELPQKWSPYVFMGCGIMRLSGDSENSDYNRNQAVIPMGIGFKHKIGKQFVVELEAGVRKTWFDHLDGISDGDTSIKNYQYGNPNDHDWYYFTGFRISYVLYKIPCPFPYVPNRSLLSR